MGQVLRVALPARRRIAERNIALCFPALDDVARPRPRKAATAFRTISEVAEDLGVEPGDTVPIRLARVRPLDNVLRVEW